MYKDVKVCFTWLCFREHINTVFELCLKICRKMQLRTLFVGETSTLSRYPKLFSNETALGSNGYTRKRVGLQKFFQYFKIMQLCTKLYGSVL